MLKLFTAAESQASWCPAYSSTTCPLDSESDNDFVDGSASVLFNMLSKANLALDPSSEDDPRTSVYFNLSVYSNQTGSPVITLSPSIEWDKEAARIGDVEIQIDNTIRWIESYTHDFDFMDIITPPPGQYTFTNELIATTTQPAADETDSQELVDDATTALATFRHTCENFPGMASPIAEPTHGLAYPHHAKPPSRKPSKLSKKRPSLSSKFIPKRKSRLLELNPLRWLFKLREKG